MKMLAEYNHYSTGDSVHFFIEGRTLKVQLQKNGVHVAMYDFGESTVMSKGFFQEAIKDLLKYDCINSQALFINYMV